MADDDDARALLGKAHTALEEIAHWCEAYPTQVFRPLSQSDINRAGAVLEKAGLSISRLHAQWARHLLDGIGRIAHQALDDQEMGDGLSES